MEGVIENKGSYTVEEYNQFVSLYNNPMVSVREIYNILGCTTRKYGKLRKKALYENKIIERQPRNYHKGKKRGRSRVINNYSYNTHSGKWIVRKGINYQTVHYGCYDTEEIAKEIVNELKKVDWDKNRLSEIEEKVGIGR